MRAIFVISLLFFILGFAVPASAGFVCSNPAIPDSYPTEVECGMACTGGTCMSETSGGGGCAPGQFCNPLASDSFEALVLSLAQWVAAIALPVVVIFIIYSGYLFVTAGGNQTKLDAAKTTFYWTMIGAAVVVGAWALATAIVDFAKKL